jgi:GDP-L-fucose synthase
VDHDAYDDRMGFWDDKCVLITGGSGFLGSALTDKLSKRGAKEARGAKEVISLGSSDYDLMRQSEVERMFDEHSPDLIFNLAARVGGIGANMARPADLYLSNLLIGTYVLEEARKRGTPKIVLAGTICAYPKFTPVPFQESALWDGYPEETNAPYGIAKKALLVHAQANRQQYGQNAIYLLPVNLYGPGDKFNEAVSHVIPALIKKCVEAKERSDDEIVVWGTGTATREFLYVDDAAEGMILAAELYDDPDPVNLGSGQEVSIKELAELIAKLSGFDGNLRWDASKPDGQPRRRLDTSRAEKAFSFTARTPLEEGLRATIDWYVSHREQAERATR